MDLIEKPQPFVRPKVMTMLILPLSLSSSKVSRPHQLLMQKKFLKRLFGVAGFLSCMVLTATAQKTTLTLDLGKPGADVSPMLYGLMTEEINHSYDGGLYAADARRKEYRTPYFRQIESVQLDPDHDRSPADTGRAGHRDLCYFQKP